MNDMLYSRRQIPRKVNNSWKFQLSIKYPWKIAEQGRVEIFLKKTKSTFWVIKKDVKQTRKIHSKIAITFAPTQKENCFKQHKAFLLYLQK